MARRQLTITVPPEVGLYIEERAAALGVDKSAVVSRALEEDRRRNMESLLREGYEEMAVHDADLAREFEQSDRVSSWPEY